MARRALCSGRFPVRVRSSLSAVLLPGSRPLPRPLPLLPPSCCSSTRDRYQRSNVRDFESSRTSSAKEAATLGWTVGSRTKLDACVLLRFSGNGVGQVKRVPIIRLRFGAAALDSHCCQNATAACSGDVVLSCVCKVTSKTTGLSQKTSKHAGTRPGRTTYQLSEK